MRALETQFLIYAYKIKNIGTTIHAKFTKKIK